MRWFGGAGPLSITDSTLFSPNPYACLLTHRANPLGGVVMTFRRIMTVTIEGVLMLTLFPQNRLGEATVRSLVPTAKMLPLPQYQVTAFKQSLQENQKRLRQYEWIETTSVRVNGEAKGQRQSHCYYGADGKVRRVPLSGSRRAPSGDLAEYEKLELSEYMDQAAKVFYEYSPPKPELIQTSQDARKSLLKAVEPGRRIRLEFRDYFKAGDLLGVELDIVDNRILDLQVSSSLDSSKDTFGLGVRFSTLADGTSYPARATLDPKGTKIRIKVENSGYRKIVR